MFWEMGMSCPAQNAHPLGAKLKGNICIVATKGDDMAVIRFELPSRRRSKIWAHWVGKMPNSEMMKLIARIG